MFSAEDKALIRTLYAEKHVSIRCIAQMVHVSRNAVRRQRLILDLYENNTRKDRL